MKLTLSKALAAICWLAALIAVAAAATQHQTAMGIAGLVAAVAAIGWGLVRWLEDDDDYSTFRADGYLKSDDELAAIGFYRCGAFIEDEGELPYRAPIRTENIYRGPVWPNDAGSVE